MATVKNDNSAEIRAKLSRILYVGRDNWKCALMVREDGTGFSMAIKKARSTKRRTKLSEFIKENMNRNN